MIEPPERQAQAVAPAGRAESGALAIGGLFGAALIAGFVFSSLRRQRG